MPAEWQHHDRCWMLWPTGIDPARYPNVDNMRQSYANTAKAIVDFEPVTMIANQSNVDECQKLCGDKVVVMPLDIDDCWARDSGPTFNLECFDAPIVLEGGAIHTDGNGTLMITEDVLFDPKRNPGLTKKEAEYILTKYLGVENFIWLIAALEFDDTGGHIDNLACFTPFNQILALSENDSEDSNYERLQENRNRLNYAKDANGKQFDIIEIHQPRYREFLNERMPLSYINFYMANRSIIMPIFNDPKDKKAIETISNIFQDRIVIPIEGLSIVEGGGGIHCITLKILIKQLK